MRENIPNQHKWLIYFFVATRSINDKLSQIDLYLQ